MQFGIPLQSVSVNSLSSEQTSLVLEALQLMGDWGRGAAEQAWEESAHMCSEACDFARVSWWLSGLLEGKDT